MAIDVNKVNAEFLKQNGIVLKSTNNDVGTTMYFKNEAYSYSLTDWNQLWVTNLITKEERGVEMSLQILELSDLIF
jgi:hypothetical protein